MDSLGQRLDQVHAQINSECKRLNRNNPTLIVVTKNHPVDLVKQLFELGETQFGENRVQEGISKATDLGLSATWHLIGQLQTNKVKQALEFATVFHSLDRENLILELGKRAASLAKRVQVFLQVNLTEDANRGGAPAGSLLQLAEEISKFENLELQGLMAVASLENEPERDFEKVAGLSQRLQSEYPEAKSLSIGMSGDYLQALAFGATHLRIGTAITGNRQN